MYIGFLERNADEPDHRLSVRVVQPKLQAVPGVQIAELIGAKNFSLRAWLDPEKLAAYGITAAGQRRSPNNDYIPGWATPRVRWCRWI